MRKTLTKIMYGALVWTVVVLMTVDVSMARWQAVCELQFQLAQYLRLIGNPP